MPSMSGIELCLQCEVLYTNAKWISACWERKEKAKKRQLRDSNPGCLTKAVINHWATKPPQKPASTILLSYYTGGTANCSLTPARPHSCVDLRKLM